MQKVTQLHKPVTNNQLKCHFYLLLPTFGKPRKKEMQYVKTYYFYFEFACKKQQISRDLLGRAFDWLKISFIQSGTQLTGRVIRMEFLRLFKVSFRGKTSGSVMKCQLFSPCTCESKETVMEISTCVGEQGMATSAVRALVSHQCSPDSNPGVDAIIYVG